MIFEELKKYKQQGQFIYLRGDNLVKVCNAPEKDASGIYLIYALKSNIEELVYIGISGHLLQNGQIKHRKDGIRGRLTHGYHRDKNRPRRKVWTEVMEEEEIDQLRVVWYLTFDGNNNDIPAYIEAKLLQEYFNKHKKLPIWNYQL